MDAVRTRRSCYAINDKLPISDDRVEELVRTALEYVPSSFNSQSTRVVLLLNDDHRTFWDFVNEVLRPMVKEGQWHKTEEKLSGFRAGHGTVRVRQMIEFSLLLTDCSHEKVLFFEDPVTTSKLQTDFPLYSDHFPSWGVQSNAMHRLYILGTAPGLTRLTFSQSTCCGVLWRQKVVESISNIITRSSIRKPNVIGTFPRSGRSSDSSSSAAMRKGLWRK
jgi:predicted oxidoreductase (fatty acid repression mutant protein)